MALALYLALRKSHLNRLFSLFSLTAKIGEFSYSQVKNTEIIQLILRDTLVDEIEANVVAP